MQLYKHVWNHDQLDFECAVIAQLQAIYTYYYDHKLENKPTCYDYEYIFLNCDHHMVVTIDMFTYL